METCTESSKLEVLERKREVLILIEILGTIFLHHVVKEREDTWHDVVVQRHRLGLCFQGGPSDLCHVTTQKLVGSPSDPLSP